MNLQADFIDQAANIAANEHPARTLDGYIADSGSAICVVSFGNMVAPKPTHFRKAFTIKAATTEPT